MKSTEELLYHNAVFTFKAAEAHFGFPGEKATLKRLQRLEARGRVVRAFRGVYASVPPGVDPDTFHPDPFLALAALRPDCVFCGKSAFDLLAVGQQDGNSFTAYSAAKAVTYKTKHGEFTLIKRPEWLTPDVVVQHNRKGILLSATRPELTVVEGFRYPGRVGGICELLNAADALPQLDLRMLRSVLNRFHMRKLYAAVGWCLSRNALHWNADTDYLSQLWRLRPASPQYLERGSSGSVLESQWNLMIPRDVPAKATSEAESPRVELV